MRKRNKKVNFSHRPFEPVQEFLGLTIVDNVPKEVADSVIAMFGGEVELALVPVKIQCGNKWVKSIAICFYGELHTGGDKVFAPLWVMSKPFEVEIDLPVKPGRLTLTGDEMKTLLAKGDGRVQ